uniref:Dynein, axonemal, light chain 1 n=1 Tax=Cyprinodon variegatus TaxID=28743 RepID=A0A3Q2CLL3_CYPVA
MQEAKDTDNKADVSKEVLMYGQIPPIEKMDTSLSVLTCCEKLSLSSNCIENITNLDSFKNLKILSLGRNNIKSLVGVEAVRDTLEELWISYNLIEKLTGVNTLQKLKVLSIRHNLVKDWGKLPSFTKEFKINESIFFLKVEEDGKRTPTGEEGAVEFLRT